jgi:hypothetical protein
MYSEHPVSGIQFRTISSSAFKLLKPFENGINLSGIQYIETHKNGGHLVFKIIEMVAFFNPMTIQL